MGVRINIHPSLRHLTNDQTVVEVNGSTIGQCLDDLIRQFPQIKRWLFDKAGKLHNYVDIYVNGESAYPDELATPVKDGDELHTIVIISGG